MITGARVILSSSDAEADRAELTGRGLTVDADISDEGWGRLTTITLPGGGRIGLYEARHPTAFDL